MAFSLMDLAVSVTSVSVENGDQITSNAVEASLTETGSNDYAVTLACADSASKFSGTYTFTLALVVDADSFSVNATRTTANAVSVDCSADYGNSSNYSDAVDGTAVQPGDDATGEVLAPENVNDGDGGTSATLKGSGGQGLNVGFALPSVSSADAYTLQITASKVTGNLTVYLVDNDGDRLSSEFLLKNKNRPFNFTVDPEEDISNRELFLIFDGGTNGRNQSQLEGFSLKPVEYSE
ncbi:hypothetical protein [Halorubrum coriense]|uniref:hypothetical protein n=1 Tax=Halorubrum coriense TaxID=64713 RepID=UPI001268E1BD|nr:hypothetical protein [Halorubrum coriense]